MLAIMEKTRMFVLSGVEPEVKMESVINFLTDVVLKTFLFVIIKA